MGLQEAGVTLTFTSKQLESQQETDLQSVRGDGCRTRRQAHILTRCRGPQRLAKTGPRRTESLLVLRGQRSLGTMASPYILRRYLRWVKG